MHLGSLIRRFERENDAGLALEAIGDMVLFAQVAQVGERFGELPAAYAAGAVSRFASMAGDDEFLSLIAALENANDPARALLTRVLRWALARDAAELGHDDAEGCTHAACF